MRSFASQTPIEHVMLGNWYLSRAEWPMSSPGDAARFSALAQGHFAAATAKATGEAIYGENFAPDVTAAGKEFLARMREAEAAARGRTSNG